MEEEDQFFLIVLILKPFYMIKDRIISEPVRSKWREGNSDNMLLCFFIKDFHESHHEHHKKEPLPIYGIF